MKYPSKLLSTSFVPVIAKALEDNEKERAVILGLTDMAAICEDAKVRFADEGLTVRVSICFYEWGTCAYLHIDVDDFRKLVPVRRWLRKRGLPAPSISDDPRSRTRRWNYGRIVMTGSLPMDGAACRYVPTGEVTTTPVYRLVCPETPEMPAMDEGEDA